MAHPPPIARLRLVHSAVSGAGVVHELRGSSEKRRWTIGRDAPADIVVDSAAMPKMISRMHAHVELEPCERLARQWQEVPDAAAVVDGEDEAMPPASHSACTCQWRLVDLRSTNGLFVNDVKATEALLKHGDLIVFGSGNGLAAGTRKRHPDHPFTFRFEEEAAAAKSGSRGSTPVHAAAAVGSQSSDRSTASVPTVPAAAVAKKRKLADEEAAVEQSLAAADRDRIAAEAAHEREQRAFQLHREQSEEKHRMIDEARREKEEVEQNLRMEATRKRVAEEEQEATRKRIAAEECERVAAEQAALERQLVEKQAAIEREKQAALARQAAEEQKARQEAIDEEQRQQQLRRREEEAQQRAKLKEAQDSHGDREQTHAAAADSSNGVAAAPAAASSSSAVPAAAPAGELSAPSTPVSFEALHQDLTCSVCSHLLLLYVELPCRHRFCAPCLTAPATPGGTPGWFTRQHTTCPMCRVEVDFHFDYQPPQLDDVRELDHTIESLAASDLFPEAERAAHEKRLADLHTRMAKDRRREKALKEHMDKARVMKQKVLAITDEWKPAERKTFDTGIGTYSYHGRLEYASFVGLTPEFLKDCSSLPVLEMVMRNLQVEVPKASQAALESIPEAIRDCSFAEEDSVFNDEQKAAFDNCKRVLYFFISFGWTKDA